MITPEWKQFIQQIIVALFSWEHTIYILGWNLVKTWNIHPVISLYSNWTYCFGEIIHPIALFDTTTVSFYASSDRKAYWSNCCVPLHRWEGILQCRLPGPRDHDRRGSKEQDRHQMLVLLIPARRWMEQTKAEDMDMSRPEQRRGIDMSNFSE